MNLGLRTGHLLCPAQLTPLGRPGVAVLVQVNLRDSRRFQTHLFRNWLSGNHLHLRHRGRERLHRASRARVGLVDAAHE
jgi:hypothetical protein